MKKFAMVIVVVMVSVIVSCATIQQDKPANASQCFEGKFNIHRVVSEDWQIAGQKGNIFFLKNPKKNKYPKVVAVLIHPMNGLIVCYAYLDGKNIVSFRFDIATHCYKQEILEKKICDMLKMHIQNFTKERLVTN